MMRMIVVTIVLHPVGQDGWISKLCFSWRILYTDLEGSFYLIWSTLRRCSNCNRSLSHSCLRKFGSVEHKPLIN